MAEVPRAARSSVSMAASCAVLSPLLICVVLSAAAWAVVSATICAVLKAAMEPVVIALI